MNPIVVVAWHNPDQIKSFLNEWKVEREDPRLILVQDTHKEGCANTKNRGMFEAVARGHDVVIIIDDDCFPSKSCPGIESLISQHVVALEPVENTMFKAVTEPRSRGTPCFLPDTPVAASMGFWEGIGDYDAVSQLVLGAKTLMQFRREAIFGRYFPLSGMNVAFNAQQWWPWCKFIDVPRFDDIWMGWIFQREAYRLGYCFNLNGPIVRHSRQSNVWKNLIEEIKHLERNETLWHDIATNPDGDYDSLVKLLPI